MIKISTSILLIKDDINKIKKLNDTDTDYIHLDVMDGKFVDNITYTFEEVSNLVPVIKKPLDVHLMVAKPSEYIDFYSKINSDYITIHLECEENIEDLIKQIKQCGKKVGVSIKPKTAIEKLYPIINDIDLVLVMSVEPGYGGQAFIDDSLSRISQIKSYIINNNLNVVINVDGGINDKNAKLCIESGATMITVGSYITSSDNCQAQIDKIR